jgi:hypothetical protein
MFNNKNNNQKKTDLIPVNIKRLNLIKLKAIMSKHTYYDKIGRKHGTKIKILDSNRTSL